MGVSATTDNWVQWHGVIVKELYDSAIPKATTNPTYQAAKNWCLGPSISGNFAGYSNGRFFFQEAKDAMAFKLAWG